VAIERAVAWHVGFGEGPTHEAAKRVVAAIPKTLSYRVTLAIADAWGDARMSRDGSNRWIQRWREEMAEISKELLIEHSDPSVIVAFVREKLEAVTNTCISMMTLL
jgi:hypothetical protein